MTIWIYFGLENHPSCSSTDRTLPEKSPQIWSCSVWTCFVLLTCLRLLRDFLTEEYLISRCKSQHNKSKKMQMLGASIGPQLLHGHGLCNFWASILRVVDIGRQVWNTSCDTIVRFRCSTLDVPQFSPGHTDILYLTRTYLRNLDADEFDTYLWCVDFCGFLGQLRPRADGSRILFFYCRVTRDWNCTSKIRERDVYVYIRIYL